jgi:hypothetical protein
MAVTLNARLRAAYSDNISGDAVSGAKNKAPAAGKRRFYPAQTSANVVRSVNHAGVGVAQSGLSLFAKRPSCSTQLKFCADDLVLADALEEPSEDGGRNQ